MINYLKKLFSASGHDGADEAKRQEERDFDLLKYDGIRAMRMGKTDYAERCFTRAVGLRRDPETLRHLATLYIGLGRYDEAIATLTTLAEAEPGKPDAHISMAGVHFTRGDYATARDEAGKALGIEAGNAEALLLAGKADARLGNMLEAIVSLTKAIEAREGYVDALLARAETLTSMRQAAEAMADVERVLSIDDGNEAALSLKASLQAMGGDTDAALATYDRLLEANPFNFDAYAAKAGILMAAGQAQQAIATLDEAIELSDSVPQLYRERGRAKMMLGDKEGAAADLKKSLEMRPEDAETINGQFTNRAAEFDNITGIFK